MRIAALTCAAALGLGVPPSESPAAAPAAELVTMGPPAICVPVEVADEKLLPWGSGAFGKQKGAYSSSSPLKDTLALLEGSRGTLAHMENLRRATIYMAEAKDTAAQQALLGRLIARAADAEADDLSARDRALAWFDAGYFAACLDQMGTSLGWAPGRAEGVWGYEWLERAAEADMSDPAIRFAMALACHPGVRESKRDLWELHMAAAIEGSGSDRAVRKNIEAHLAHWDERVSDFAG